MGSLNVVFVYPCPIIPVSNYYHVIIHNRNADVFVYQQFGADRVIGVCNVIQDVAQITRLLMPLSLPVCDFDVHARIMPQY